MAAVCTAWDRNKMTGKKLGFISVAAFLLLVTLVVIFTINGFPVSGLVVDENNNPIQNAIVKIRAIEVSTQADAKGTFTIPIAESFSADYITAWSKGYYISGEETGFPHFKKLKITLLPFEDKDHPEYEWLPVIDRNNENGLHGENQACSQCHSSQGSDLAFELPVDEWLRDAHSASATNVRFISMYAGTDLSGNQSPVTQYGYSKDYGSFPLRPDQEQTYFGPGYLLDFPNSAGNCAACHIPELSIDKPYGIRVDRVDPKSTNSISCDFCHKIYDVVLNPDTQLPYENMPGVLSYDFRRPGSGHQLFIGPMADVAPGEDTYSPLYQSSQYCAGCHYGVFWGTEIYNSFGEWQNSEYSDPVTGKTCQDCHMPNNGAKLFALPEMGGLIREPDSIFGHYMPGAADEQLLQNAVTMEGEITLDEDVVTLQISIVNDQTGHNVPTDSPMRHLILLVKAFDDSGTPLELESGPLLPAWAGIGDPDDGYYADQPGKIYAKVLKELWTDIAPSASYWNPTQIILDNRLQPFEEDVTEFSFLRNNDEAVEVSVKLLYRRAFIELMDQKGWSVPDILMEEMIFSVK